MGELINAFKAAEDQVHDELYEVIERLRFITGRLSNLETAMGVGYIDDAGQTYKGHIAADLPESVAPEKPNPPKISTPVVGATGFTTLA